MWCRSKVLQAWIACPWLRSKTFISCRAHTTTERSATRLGQLFSLSESGRQTGHNRQLGAKSIEGSPCKTRLWIIARLLLKSSPWTNVHGHLLYIVNRRIRGPYVRWCESLSLLAKADRAGYSISGSCFSFYPSHSFNVWLVCGCSYLVLFELL